jgi:uncharacterized protein YkvS
MEQIKPTCESPDVALQPADVSVPLAEPLKTQADSVDLYRNPDQDDLGWLSELAGHEIRLTEFGWINFRNLYELSNRSLDDVGSKSRLEIIGARQKFFGRVLGWDDPRHVLRRPYKRLANKRSTLMPPKTTFGTMRVLHGYGVNLTRAIKVSPAALSYNPESVRAKMKNLEDLGLDAARVVNALPAALSYNPESVRAKMKNLEDLGLDAARVVNALPTALGYSPKSVQAKMANLKDLGLNAARVVNALPAALAYNPESVRAKMTLLAPVFKQDSSLRDNMSFIKGVLILPIESLLVYMSERYSPDDDPTKIPYQARSFMGSKGVTNAPGRKEYLKQHKDELVKNMGCIAIRVLHYTKTDGAETDQLLCGATVEQCPLLVDPNVSPECSFHGDGCLEIER